MENKVKRGQQKFKADREPVLTRLNSRTPTASSYLNRLKWLKEYRKQTEPTISITDLICEAVELMLEGEDVPKIVDIKDDRKGVEL